MVVLKSDNEIEKMYKVGQMTGLIMNYLTDQIKEGITTLEIDRMARWKSKEVGAVPAFLGYAGFPKAICVSVNDEIVHGIPSKKRIIKNGDMVSLDFGLIYDGYYSDTARTLIVGSADAAARKLNEVTKECLDRGINSANIDNRISDIGIAVENCATQNRFSVVREYVGHGIGKELHEDPQIPNYRSDSAGVRIVAGMVLAIEPMINEGESDLYVKRNRWTVATKDHKRSSHFEDTVAITEDGVKLLTRIN